MGIWFYLFAAAVCLLAGLLLKIRIMKKEIERIGKTLVDILEADTNHLITVNTNDRSLRKLASLLNGRLKNLRQEELAYKNGNQALKTSITNISHDLRTPLTAVRGYLDLMNTDRFDEQQLKYIRIIDRKVEDMTDLTERLFDFSKSLDVQNEIKREFICINDVLEDVVVSFYSLLCEHGVSPQIEICKEKVFRWLDENMLKRIFENIISNAAKYSEGDFNIKMYPNGTIEFSNTTDAFNPVSVEKIFDRYYTVRNAKKSTGIGLSIARQLVDLNDGSIEAGYQENTLTVRIAFN